MTQVLQTWTGGPLLIIHAGKVKFNVVYMKAHDFLTTVHAIFVKLIDLAFATVYDYIMCNELT